MAGSLKWNSGASSFVPSASAASFVPGRVHATTNAAASTQYISPTNPMSMKAATSSNSGRFELLINTDAFILGHPLA